MGNLGIYSFSPNLRSTIFSWKTEIGHEHVLKLRTWLEVVSYESLSFLNMIVVFPGFTNLMSTDLRMDLNPSSVDKGCSPLSYMRVRVNIYC